MKILVIIILTFQLMYAFGQDSQDGKFTKIEEAVRNPKKVRELQLSGIAELLPTLDKFINLRIVRLINLSKDYDLEDAFEKLSNANVEELYLYGNAHKELPENINKLAKLKKIDLNVTLYEKLEQTLKILSRNSDIEYIGLRGFRLIFLPNELTEFKKLKKLNLGDNSSLSYDQAFELLSKIETIESLNFDYNYFSGLPEAILRLKNLKELEFSMLSGKFNIPETYIILAKLNKLEKLDISGNFFGEFPQEISLLNKLKVLNIDGNGIAGEVFDKLKKLFPNTKLINENPY